MCARPGLSGRLEHCLPIGESHHRAYRVPHEIIEVYG